MSFEEICVRFNARRVGRGKAMAKCAAHRDHSPSLSITQGHGGRTLLHCHARCRVERVVEAVGLSMADLFEDGGRNKRLHFPTPHERRAAEERRKREEQRQASYQARRQQYRDMAACVRVLDQRSDTLAKAMAGLSEDSPEFESLSQLTGRTIHLLTAFERGLHAIDAELRAGCAMG